MSKKNKTRKKIRLDSKEIDHHILVAGWCILIMSFSIILGVYSRNKSKDSTDDVVQKKETISYLTEGTDGVPLYEESFALRSINYEITVYEYEVEMSNIVYLNYQGVDEGTIIKHTFDFSDYPYGTQELSVDGFGYYGDDITEFYSESVEDITEELAASYNGKCYSINQPYNDDRVELKVLYDDYDVSRTKTVVVYTNYSGLYFDKSELAQGEGHEGEDTSMISLYFPYLISEKNEEIIDEDFFISFWVTNENDYPFNFEPKDLLTKGWEVGNKSLDNNVSWDTSVAVISTPRNNGTCSTLGEYYTKYLKGTEFELQTWRAAYRIRTPQEKVLEMASYYEDSINTYEEYLLELEGYLETGLEGYSDEELLTEYEMVKSVYNELIEEYNAYKLENKDILNE